MRITPNGQTSTQVPQAVHSSSFTKTISFSFLIASTGQCMTQQSSPQETQCVHTDGKSIRTYLRWTCSRASAWLTTPSWNIVQAISQNLQPVHLSGYGTNILTIGANPLSDRAGPQ